MLTFPSSLPFPAFHCESDCFVNRHIRVVGVSPVRYPNRARAKPPAKPAASTAANRLRGGTFRAAIALVLLAFSGASERGLAEDRRVPARIAMPEFGTLRPIDSGNFVQDWLKFPPQWAREPRTALNGAPVQFGRFSLKGVSVASTGPSAEDHRSERRSDDLQDVTFSLSRYLLGIRRRFGLNVRPEPIARVRAPHESRAAARRMDMRAPESAAQPVVELPPERRLEGGIDDGSWTKAPLFMGRANGADATAPASSEKRSKGAPNADEVPLDKRPERATNAAPEAAKAPVNPLFITRSNGGT
jgi:hypothetical protein